MVCGYTGLGWGKLYVGHQKQPYSLDLEMSSNDMPFIERGTDVDLIVPFVDRAIGIRGDFSGDNWFVAAGFYGDSVRPNDNGDEGWGAAARAIFTPILTEDKVLHFGVRGAFRDPTESMIRIRAETTHFSNLFPVNTGNQMGIRHVLIVGPEFAAVCGPVSLTGEYNHMFMERRSGGALDFSSWNVAAAWSITGESRAASYKMSGGEFKRLKPAENFSLAKGTFGAFELATRYAMIDLNDRNVNGGSQGVYNLALNWYLNPVVRVMFDWSRIVDTSAINRALEGLNTFQGRVQISF
jgi:phosphate-selective porin OprO/OprP